MVMEVSVETFEQFFHWAFVAVGVVCVILVLRALGKLLAMFRFRGSLAVIVSAGVAGFFLYVLLAHPRAGRDAVPVAATAPAALPARQMQPETPAALARPEAAPAADHRR